MKDNNPNISRFTVRLDTKLLRKFCYIASYEGRSGNSELIQIIQKHVKEFEKNVGPLPDDLD